MHSRLVNNPDRTAADTSPGGGVARGYAGEAGRRYHEGKRSVADRAVPWVSRIRAAKLAAHIQDGDVVLEHGVGYGWNLAAIRCRRRLGYDTAECLSGPVRALGIEWVADLAEVGAGTLDVVVSHHTLEHLLEPAAALRQLRLLLRPGGRLLLTVPWDREWGQSRFRRGEPNRHLYTWNAQSLGNLVEACGYAVDRVAVARYGYDRFAANQAVRWHLGEPGFRLLRRVLIGLRPRYEIQLCAHRLEDVVTAPSPGSFGH